MKSKLLLLLLSGLVIFISGCQKEEPEDNSAPVNAKLKQVLLFSDLDSKEPISVVEEYVYNEDGKIEKVSSPMYDNGKITGTNKYDLYEYDSSGQLTGIRNYNANINSPTGFINLKNKSYTYSPEGYKIKETTEYPSGGLSEYTVFEYTNGLLSKMIKYSGNLLESYTLFQFDTSDKLIKETFYASDDQCLSYTIHTYSGQQQIESDLYIYSTDERYRSINRTFDKNNNITVLESNELALYSSMMSHVLRYKYYE